METWKRFSEKEASHSMVHYVQAVAACTGPRGGARVGDVAAHLAVSKASVTSMMRSLQARGLVTHELYGEVALTETGRSLAERTASNRQVLTQFLTDILGVPESVAVEDACMVEHLVSPQVVTELLRLTTFLRSGDPLASQLRQAFRGDGARSPAGEAP